MRAIDLYAGIGGWRLGLELAGIDVVASYEWWRPAINTHNGNHAGSMEPTDIRKLDLRSLPTDIDVVVGSPPCTEFSYANRGGSGDLAEGLKDLVRFFEIVDYLKPKFWAMENVPRVAEVLRHGFVDPQHTLFRFRHLKPLIDIVDFSEFGAAQARRRCIATNIPFEGIATYKSKTRRPTLGDVVGAFSSGKTAVDPIWGATLPLAKVTETQLEPFLNPEELRMNREAKEFHPVYNNMAFPDPLEETSRTVTATCTRVSRESIVIEDKVHKGRYRRLTIRERASLQGFPITYQFYAKSFAEKAKMIGNAIPPTFTYIIGLLASGANAASFKGHNQACALLKLPNTPAPVTPPDGEGRSYPTSRGFRAALPGLRFKSGMRFDLSNSHPDTGVEWRVRFFYGPSTDIREIPLDGTASARIWKRQPFASILEAFRGNLVKAGRLVEATSPDGIQMAWAHKKAGPSPYELVDQLGSLADELYECFVSELNDDDFPVAADLLMGIAVDANKQRRIVGQAKLEKNALRVVAGLVIADWFNALSWHNQQRFAA